MTYPWTGMQRRDWLLWAGSCAVLLGGSLLGGAHDPLNLIATLTGATCLIVLAKGNVWGQILTVVFSLMYGVISWRARYWGEMVTYLGMTMPIAAAAVISWLRHPSAQQDGSVEVGHITRRQLARLMGLTVIVTAALSLLLAKLDTPNLAWSCLSIATSFLAASLALMRSAWYAVAYAANDLVLIVLWVLMTLEDPGSLPMVLNFGVFLINDLYGFFSWRRR